MTETTALARQDAPELTPFEVMERVIASGDIGRMDPQARVAFYWRTCESLGLNPLTQPFSYLNLDGKLVLYARKDATEQLRRVNHVSVTSLTRDRDDAAGLYTVYAHGRLPDGREDEATGVVYTKGLSGNALANALMKAETKAKRRLTLSLVGLGFLDESEIEGLGEPVDVDQATGEIRSTPKPSLLQSVKQQVEALESVEPTEVAADLGELEQAIERTIEEPILAEPMTPEASAVVEPEPDEGDDVPLDDVPLTAAVTGLSSEQFRNLAHGKNVTRERWVECLASIGIPNVGRHAVAGTIDMLTDEQRLAVARYAGIVEW